MLRKGNILFAALIFATVCAFGADTEEKARAFAEAETAVDAGLVPQNVLKFLRNASGSDDAGDAAQAARLLAVHFRREKDYAQAWRYLEPYATPSGYDRLPPRGGGGIFALHP